MSGPRYKNISGKKFNKLTAIKPTFKKDTNGSMIWVCLCDCGKLTTATYSNLQRGHKKSCGCAIQDYINSLTYDISGQRFGMLIAQYSNGKRKRDGRIVWHCVCDCGNECDVDVNSLMSEHTQSCGCSHRSLGEQYIESILDDCNIIYHQQFTFDDCVNIYKLPFDFYLPTYNLCIEYDGEQHFRSVDHFGGEDGFRQRKRNDEIKNQYCQDNNIKLLRIPYTTPEEKIKEIILNILNP